MIDWDRINELRDEVGGEDFEEVVELFLEEVEDVISKLRKTPAMSTLEQDLHFLKGSALSLGFKEFSSLCQNGETLAANNHATSVDLKLLLDSYDASKSLFLSQRDLELAT
ncbi:MAG: Hpt domain-containing protein [Sedimentitalea sp.]